MVVVFCIIEYATRLTKLWSEDFHRRCLHHLQNGKYNPNKIPLILFPTVMLNNNEIEYALSVADNKKTKCLNNLSKTASRLLGGNYSQKCSLYYSDFDALQQERLDAIGERLRIEFEPLVGKPLFLGESNFRCCILRYEGIDSNFKFHYDTEESNCFRCIFLIRKEGNISPFSYVDKDGKIKEKRLDVGEGILFQGTRTYHGVAPNTDPNSIRYVVGWQFSTNLHLKTKSLCDLRDATPMHILSLFAPRILLFNALVYAWNKYGPRYPISNKALLMTTLAICAASTTLPPCLPKGVGTRLPFNIKEHSIFLVLCIISSISSPADGVLLFNYKVASEMLFPSRYVAKPLRSVGHNT